MRLATTALASALLVSLVPALPGTLLGPSPLAAQHLVPDSLFRTRAPARPVLRVWEAGLVLGVTAGAMAIDQSVRDDAREHGTGFRHNLSDFGNAFGNKFYVYPALVAGTLGGLAVKSRGLTRVSWRALEATALAGASVELVKTAVGRRRPDISPEDAFTFRGFTLKDNSFPSGHTAIAFALATSLSRETRDRWSDAGFYALATLTAFSRVNDDRHWLSDTVFGAALGIVSARLVERWHRPILVGPGVVGVSATF
jgi:membrane-associated phospholipid phosphatase